MLNWRAIGRWVGMPKLAGLADVPYAWEDILRGSAEQTKQQRAEAINKVIRNLVSRAPKQFAAMRGRLGGTSAVMHKVYPSIVKLLRRF